MRFLRHVRFFFLAMIHREYGIMWREMLTWWIWRDV